MKVSLLSWALVESPIDEVPGWRTRWFEDRTADPLLVGVYPIRATGPAGHEFTMQIERTRLMSLNRPANLIRDRCEKSRSAKASE